MDLQSHLAQMLETDEESLAAVLMRHDIPVQFDGLSVDFHFYSLKSPCDASSLDVLLGFLMSRVVGFCQPYRVRRRAVLRYEETGDEAYLADLVRRSKALFISTARARSAGGEPGELLLFTLVEGVLRAPQVVCKMTLKTSRDMPVHGIDGIFARESSASSLELFWGESKLNESLAAALDDFLDSVSGFVGPEGGSRTRRSRDLEIVTDHPSLYDPDATERLLQYLDPYHPVGEVRERQVCLAAFTFGTLAALVSLPEDTREDRLREICAARAEKAAEAFASKLNASPVRHLDYVLFALPFESVAAFRTRFFERLDELV